jgi:hypothetical protein
VRGRVAKNDQFCKTPAYGGRHSTSVQLTASATRPLRMSVPPCPVFGAPVPCPLAAADDMFMYRTVEAAWCPGAVRWAAALETNRMGDAGSSQGGPEKNLRTAAGAGPILARARGRGGGHGIVLRKPP